MENNGTRDKQSKTNQVKQKGINLVSKDNQRNNVMLAFSYCWAFGFISKMREIIVRIKSNNEYENTWKLLLVSLMHKCRYWGWEFRNLSWGHTASEQRCQNSHMSSFTAIHMHFTMDKMSLTVPPKVTDNKHAQLSHTKRFQGFGTGRWVLKTGCPRISHNFPASQDALKCEAVMMKHENK